MLLSFAGVQAVCVGLTAGLGGSLRQCSGHDVNWGIEILTQAVCGGISCLNCCILGH